MEIQKQNYIVSENKIVNTLQNLKIQSDTTQTRILEFGMGNFRCRYSRMLRKAYPDSFILAFDLPPKTVNHETLKVVDEVRVMNINTKRFKKYKESFDLVTFGSHRVNPGFHFGFLTPEVYKKALGSLDYYLKPGGYFVGILKSNKITNIRQKNNFDRELDADIKRKEKNQLIYDEVSSLTGSFFSEIGNYQFEEHEILDEDVIKSDRIGCAEMLKTRLEMNIVSEEYYNKWLKRAQEIDQSIKEHGEEWGYFKIQIAKKINK